jgi:hypothetical protein
VAGSVTALPWTRQPSLSGVWPVFFTSRTMWLGQRAMFRRGWRLA